MKNKKPDLRPVLLKKDITYNERVLVPAGSLGVVDIANPWSMMMGDYYYGYWLVNGKADHNSVMVTDIEPLRSSNLTKEELRLLRECEREASRPIPATMERMP